MIFRPISTCAIATLALGVGCADTVVPLETSHRGGAGTPFPPASTFAYRIATGKPSGINPGQQVGYGIMVLGAGQFRFTWTGDAQSHGAGAREFWGSVWTRGHITDLSPGCAGECALETATDYLSGVQPIEGGERVDWDTIATTLTDGFDLTTHNGEPLYVDLFVDGQHSPSVVFFTSAETDTVTSPAVLPFAVTSQ